jgi:hypothetical protein
MMQVIVLANAGLRSGDGLSATKDTVLRARLTDPSIAGQKPPRTRRRRPRVHVCTALQGPPIGRCRREKAKYHG